MEAEIDYTNIEEICHGQDVVITCNAGLTDFRYIDWYYNGMSLGLTHPINTPINTTRDVIVSGFTFTLELTSSGNYPEELISTLSFRANATMNGTDVTCEFYIRYAAGQVGHGWVLIFSEERKCR